MSLKAFFAGGNPRSTVVLPEGRERVAGLWPGGIVELELGRFGLLVRGFRGDLEPIDGTVALARETGELRGAVRITVVGPVAAEWTYTVRAFSTAAGYQRWEVQGYGLVLNSTLGDEALRAYVRAAYLPLTTVTGLDSPHFGVAAAAGLSVWVSRTPIVAMVEYSIERYDFPQASERLEQFDQLIVGMGLGFRTRPRQSSRYPRP